MIADRATVVPWRAPDVVPTLSDGEVVVWRARISALEDVLTRLRQTLTDDERARADRFHFAADRARYTVAHAGTRLILGHYTGVRAESLAFADGAFGKPCVSAPSAAVGVEFNLSHSGDYVALAVSRAGAVGVDVERHAAIPDLLELSEHCFSPAERATLRTLPNESRARAFFDCWSRKEAYIKATGLGVSSGLDYFDVALMPGAPARLLADRSRAGDAAKWEMFDLDFGEGYSGALVAPRGVTVPAQFRLTARLIGDLLKNATSD